MPAELISFSFRPAWRASSDRSEYAVDRPDLGAFRIDRPRRQRNSWRRCPERHAPGRATLSTPIENSARSAGRGAASRSAARPDADGLELERAVDEDELRRRRGVDSDLRLVGHLRGIARGDSRAVERRLSVDQIAVCAAAFVARADDPD